MFTKVWELLLYREQQQGTTKLRQGIEWASMMMVKAMLLKVHFFKHQLQEERTLTQSGRLSFLLLPSDRAQRVGYYFSKVYSMVKGDMKADCRPSHYTSYTGTPSFWWVAEREHRWRSGHVSERASYFTCPHLCLFKNCLWMTIFKSSFNCKMLLKR